MNDEINDMIQNCPIVGQPDVITVKILNILEAMNNKLKSLEHKVDCLATTSSDYKP